MNHERIQHTAAVCVGLGSVVCLVSQSPASDQDLAAFVEKQLNLRTNWDLIPWCHSERARCCHWDSSPRGSVLVCTRNLSKNFQSINQIQASRTCRRTMLHCVLALRAPPGHPAWYRCSDASATCSRDFANSMLLTTCELQTVGRSLVHDGMLAIWTEFLELKWWFY